MFKYHPCNTRKWAPGAADSIDAVSKANTREASSQERGNVVGGGAEFLVG